MSEKRVVHYHRHHHHHTPEEIMQAFTYQEQGKTIRETALLCGVSESTVKDWNRQYRIRGKAFLKSKERTYSRYLEATKTAAVKAYLGGEDANEVAARFGILRTQSIYAWSHDERYRGGVAVEDEKRAPRKNANVLARDFSAPGPMEKLVSDVTQFNVGRSKVYLFPLIDPYNGEVVSWRAGTSPTVEFVLGMLEDAAGRLDGSGAVVHTDQGFQYQNCRWSHALERYGCMQSMSRKGNCLDNACAESFFGHLKKEFSDGSDFSQPARFIRALDEWIAWYNNGRIKESLCGMAPVEYRLAHECST